LIRTGLVLYKEEEGGEYQQVADGYPGRIWGDGKHSGGHFPERGKKNGLRNTP
jgi:hypothetical protein